MGNYFYMIKKISHSNPRLLYESLAVTFANDFPNIVNIIILQEILIALESTNSLMIVIELIILYGAITIISSTVVNYLSVITIPKRQQMLVRDLKTELFEIVSDEKLESFDNPDFYNSMTLAFQVSEGQSLDAVNSIASLVTLFISLFALTTIIVSIEPWLIAMALLVSIVSLYYGIKQSKIRAQFIEKSIRHTRERSYFEGMFTKKNSIKEMKMYSRSKRIFHTNYQRCVDRIISELIFQGKKLFLVNVKNSTFYIINLMAILLVLSREVIEGRQMIGSVVAAISGTQQMTSVLSSFAGTFSEIKQDNLIIGKYREFLGRHSEKEDYSKPENLELKQKIVNIDINRLSFRFLNEDEYLLKDISLSIPSGSKVAFVGPNGSGKSVLTKIIAGLYEPTKGKLFLNGKEYSECGKGEVQQNISVVYQDFAIFSLSIAENVLMEPYDGSYESKRAVEEALAFSGLINKIKRLPSGIETRVTKEFSENGIVLSGGELQRLAIARAYANKRPVFIFDELNSSIDSIGELELLDKVNRYLKDTTVIFVTHRPQCLKLSQTIYVVDKGKIVESGTYNSLMNEKKVFYKMFNSSGNKTIEGGE